MKKDFEIIKEVFSLLKNKGKTVIVGGFLRDSIMNKPFNDVDFLTTCPFDKVKEIFPSLFWTDTSIAHGIAYLKYKKLNIDFSFCTDEDFQAKLLDRDFTINSFYFDGTELMKLDERADKDIEQKILRPFQNFESSLTYSPKRIVRSLRFTGVEGFQWDPELDGLLKRNWSLIENIPKSQLDEEIYTTIKGNYLLLAMYYLMRAGIISYNEKLNEKRNKVIETYGNSIKAKLVYIDHLLGSDTVKEFLETFRLNEKFYFLSSDYEDVFRNDKLEIKQKDFPFITILKRYQYQNNKEKILKFLKENSNR